MFGCIFVKTKRDVSLGVGCLVHHSQLKKKSIYIYKKRKVATQYCFGHNTMKNSTARRKQIKLISAIINYTKAFLINLSCWGSYETPTLHLF